MEADKFCGKLLDLCIMFSKKISGLDEYVDQIKLSLGNDSITLANKFTRDVLIFGNEHMKNIIAKNYSPIYQYHGNGKFDEVSGNFKKMIGLCSEKEQEIVWREIKSLILLAVDFSETKFYQKKLF